MSLPSAADQLALAQSLAAHAATQSVNILGLQLDATQLGAIFEVAVAAACMKQWQAAHEAGKAAAAAITSEAEAEAAQRAK